MHNDMNSTQEPQPQNKDPIALGAVQMHKKMEEELPT